MEDKARMVALHKNDTEIDGVVWQIELDGVNTSIGFTQDLIDDLPASKRYGMLDEIVDVMAESLADHNYPITEKEKERLNKLLQCMT